MKVSIIIPVYNVSRYLVRCLDSVVAQTYQNLECIIVDDCGKDNSATIAKQYIQDYQGSISFKLLHHSHNRGLSAARNTGIKASSGEYLYFLDSDDTIVPDAIESLVRLFEKYPDIDFAQGNILTEDGNISSYGLSVSIPEYSNDYTELNKIMLSEITTVAWNRLIKKSFVIKHKLYFPEGYYTEDMFWGYFITKYINAAAFTQKGLYVYYINEGSMMTSPANHIKWFTSRLWTSWQYLKDIKQNGSNKYQRQYLAINLLSCLPELYYMRSIKLWCHFWREVCSIVWAAKAHPTLYRSLFFLCLMPPICFISGRNAIRWRIQQKVISSV